MTGDGVRAGLRADMPLCLGHKVAGHIFVVLRRSPARITSPSPSPCRRADIAHLLTRHLAGSRGRGTSSSGTCAELGVAVRSVLDRSEREEVRLHQPRCQTLPFSAYKGT